MLDGLNAVDTLAGVHCIVVGRWSNRADHWLARVFGAHNRQVAFQRNGTFRFRWRGCAVVTKSLNGQSLVPGEVSSQTSLLIATIMS